MSEEQSSGKQTESHSELFGLDPTNNSEHKGHPAPGGPIAGTIDPVGGDNKGPEPASSGSKVGGVTESDGAGGSERPGAGSSTVTPSQGTNKVADD